MTLEICKDLETASNSGSFHAGNLATILARNLTHGTTAALVCCSGIVSRWLRRKSDWSNWNGHCNKRGVHGKNKDGKSKDGINETKSKDGKNKIESKSSSGNKDKNCFYCYKIGHFQFLVLILRS